MNVGIFGGAFNPPHIGHRRALESFIKELSLDKVYIIPSFLSPHKDTPELSASFEDRLKMCSLAFSDVSAEVILSDVERRLYDLTGKKSYTANTVAVLNENRPFLFVGSDMFFTLDSWQNALGLFKNVRFAVMSREDDGEKVAFFKEKFEKDYHADITVIKDEPIIVSSTEIREKNVGNMTSEKVDLYIKEHRLYDKKKTKEELLETVSKTLPERRLNHTLSVMEESEFLADELAPDLKNDILRAAILHDATKYYTKEEHLALLKNPSEDDLKSPETLHALSGGEFARRVLFEGENVCRMIEKHTTGDADMSVPEMIIFVADYTEKTREHLSCKKERKLLHEALMGSREEKYRALEKSVERILENTIKYLLKKESFIHPKTLLALEYLKGRKLED